LLTYEVLESKDYFDINVCNKSDIPTQLISSDKQREFLDTLKIPIEISTVLGNDITNRTDNLIRKSDEFKTIRIKVKKNLLDFKTSDLEYHIPLRFVIDNLNNSWYEDLYLDLTIKRPAENINNDTTNQSNINEQPKENEDILKKPSIVEDSDESQ
jgi:hypothetical protein